MNMIYIFCGIVILCGVVDVTLKRFILWPVAIGSTAGLFMYLCGYSTINSLVALVFVTVVCRIFARLLKK